MVIHHVFFWLKDPQRDREKLIRGLQTLSNIPSVQEIHIGVPAATEARGVVDHSFSVSELLFFSDLQGQKDYQEHPIHLQFVKDHGQLWDKVVVYDANTVDG